MDMDMEIDDESPLPQYSDLLSAPGTIDFQTTQRIRPQFLQDHHAGSRNITKDTEFNRQYAHAYFVRLRTAYPIIAAKIKKEWTGIDLKKIAELCETSSATYHAVASPKKNQPKGKDYFSPKKQVPLTSNEHEQHIACKENVVVAIIGTIFKQQPDKPSILQELVEEIQITDTTTKETYISEKDVVQLEDESTRVRLIPGKKSGMSINGLVNGIICGVKGKPTIDGKFEVMEVMWATPDAPIWPPIKQCDPIEMIFVSGLNFSSDTDSFSIEMNLLFEHLQGISGSNYEQNQILGKRTRVFFVGDTIQPSSSTGPNRFKETAQLTGQMDKMFSELAKTMEVFVVSGKGDPVEPMFPQPPFHKCLFPISSKYESFHLLSNPSQIEVPMSFTTKTKSNSLLNLVLTDGEPVKDAMRYSDVKSPLEMSRRFLEWAHICPTAPDTLPLHPGITQDPFMLEKQLPHIFIVGNQKEFATMEWKGSKVVTLPRFSLDHTAVLFSKERNFIPLQFSTFL